MKAEHREQPAFALRAAGDEDCHLVLEWTNEMRSCGLTLSGSEPLDRGAHATWFSARLEDPDSWMWIVEHDAAPVGVVRLEPEAGSVASTVSVSVFILRECRRQGLASAAIERALRDVAYECGPYDAIAHVRPENTGSWRLFETLGFCLAERHDDHVVFHRRVTA